MVYGASVARSYCPDARYEFHRVPVRNNKGEEDFVLALRVHYREEKLVETTDGNAFVRAGEEKRKLTEAEKREIRINKGEIEYELEPVTLKWPDDFDLQLVDQLVASYIAKRSLKGAFSREDILTLIHLGKKKGGAFVPNLACALVFASNPRTVIPGCRLRISRYEGTEEAFGKRLNQSFDTYVDGPLPVQIAEAERVMVALIKNFTRLGSDGRFYTRPEYPHDVWLIAKDWHYAKALLEDMVVRKILELRRKSGKERESSKRYFLNSKLRQPAAKDANA